MEQQETPADYDFWSAIWLLSCAVGRSVVVDRPRAPVFLNPYIILVANSGVTRKSSSVNGAKRFAVPLLEDDPSIGLLEAKTTPEKLDAILAERTRLVGTAGAAICISELAVFLGTERYNASMPALLTDLYDCPDSRVGGGGIASGARSQSSVFVNFLSASTPAWLHRSVNPNVVEGGFTSRCIFVVSEQPKRRIAWADNGQGSSQEDVSARLLSDLRLARTQGRNNRTITLNDTALRTFRQWYAKRTYNLDPFRSSFESREDAHVLRLAAFLCINDGSWVVQHQHIKAAIKLIAAVKFQASRLFEGTGTNTKWVLAFERLRDTLIKGGTEPIPRSQLYLKVRGYIDAHEFQAMLDVMHEMSAIQRFVGTHEGAGRPSELIRGTSLLAGKQITRQVAERLED